MADEDKVKLQSQEGQVFETTVGVAKLSVTIKALIEGLIVVIQKNRLKLC
jgi:hypothetical protein